MELFLELASTVALTLLLCYFIGKLVSSSPNGGTMNRDGKIGVRDCNFRVESAVRGSEIEERFDIIEKVEGEEVLKNLSVEEFVNGSEIEEDEASGEKLVEQESYGENRGFSEREEGNIGEIEVCSSNNDEMSGSKCECEEKDEDRVKEGFLSDEEEDDWVGIERTELERLFGEALVFVGSRSNYDKVSGMENDLKLKLYGLHKIATQGPCLDPQPMALKVSARAKWNAWQQLGEMTPEMAMEQYIWLLSEKIPGWMRDRFRGDGKQGYLGAGVERKHEELKAYH
ncbi:acyl-CoA-binding domain-containing protein 3 [Morus notabilis]|nr:acyl-CoA-binding domain-containing protein 3 [Morus notabilis]